MTTIQLIQIYIELWSAVLCAVFAVSLFIIRKEEPKSTRTLRHMFFLMMILLIADVFAIYYRGNTTTIGWWATRISNYLVFALFIVISMFSVAFLLETIGDHGRKIPRRWAFVMGLIGLVSLILLTISQFTDWYYYFDETNHYTRGSWYLLSNVGPVVIISLYLACMIYYHKMLGTFETLALASYVVFPAIATVIQTLNYGIGFVNIALVLSALMLFGQRMSSRSQAVREARLRIALERAKRGHADDEMLDERMRRASLGKGNIKHIFIVNPFAGVATKVEELREIIAKLPEDDYFVFTTRGPKSETQLIRRVMHYFEGYKLRIYCCGGSGTLRNVIEGIDDLSKVEIGFYPCGLSNDFLKVFGEDEEKFHHIENLIDGEAIPIDYIRTNHGIALNALSIGKDQRLMDAFERYRALSRMGNRMPYFMAVVQSMFHTGMKEYEIEVDGKTYTGRHPEVIFGNGCVIAGLFHFAPKGRYRDGYASVFMADKSRYIGTWRTALALMSSDMDRVSERGFMGNAETFKIRHKDGSPIAINLDGEIEYGYMECEASVVHQGLNFIIPKEVESHG